MRYFEFVNSVAETCSAAIMNCVLRSVFYCIISFMQGIYTYIPETNFVPREYSVAAILLLLFMVLISLVSVLNLLYLFISTFRSMCAEPIMTVFCSSLTSCFPGMLLTYFLNDFQGVPVAPIITGITFVFTFHMRCISIVRSLLLLLLSSSSSSPLCRVFILIFLRQTTSLGNTVLQLFCCYYSWCLYR